jgi:DNA-binding MarR family transcriptional regulator
MVAKGLVERCSHATDRRARVVHLTEAGRTLIAAAFADHAAAMEQAAGGLTGEERAQLAALLKKLGRFTVAMGAPVIASEDESVC